MSSSRVVTIPRQHVEYAVSPATRKSTVTVKETTRKSISRLVTRKSASRKVWLIEPVWFGGFAYIKEECEQSNTVS